MSVRERFVERQIVTRSEGADRAAAMELLEGLPGIKRVCSDPGWDRFYIAFDPRMVSDDELLAALKQHGFEFLGVQPSGVRGRGPEREWLLEQITSLIERAEDEQSMRGEYADGMVRGAVDAYVRTGRAFGLIADGEIADLIPARFLEHV
jgi:hypothetical protein